MDALLAFGINHLYHFSKIRRFSHSAMVSQSGYFFKINIQLAHIYSSFQNY